MKVDAETKEMSENERQTAREDANLDSGGA